MVSVVRNRFTKGIVKILKEGEDEATVLEYFNDGTYVVTYAVFDDEKGTYV